MECPTTPDAWKRVALGFENRWNFAHTCGALDGKHVAIRKPPGGGSNYFNYKKFHSIVLMAVVDYSTTSCMWMWAHLEVLVMAVFGKKQGLERTWKVEQQACLIQNLCQEKTARTSHMRWLLMKPLHYGPGFNYRLSRARRVVENYFGILANRFRCLLKTMEQRPKNVESMVYAACVLHNLIRMRGAAAGSATSIQDGDIVDSDRGSNTRCLEKWCEQVENGLTAAFER